MATIAEPPAKAPKTAPSRPAFDRPGWIPAHITENWDTDPNAYQTEEELMPQGGAHAVIIRQVQDVIEPYVKRLNMMSLSDVFVIFRDENGVLQRNHKAADVMVVPYKDPAPKAWYIDKYGPPLLTMEVLSDEDEEVASTKDIFIAHGVKCHVVIDQLDADGNVGDKVKVTVWGSDGQERQPDAGGYLDLPELGLKVRAVSPRTEFTFYDGETLEPLKYSQDALAEKAVELAEKDDALAEKVEELAEKDDALAEKAVKLAEKDDALAEKVEELAEKDDALVQKNEALAGKVEELAKKDEALAQKVEELAKRDEALAKAEAEREKLLAELEELRAKAK